MLVKSHFIFTGSTRIKFQQRDNHDGNRKIVDNLPDKEGRIPEKRTDWSLIESHPRDLGIPQLLPNRMQAQKKRAEQRYNTSLVRSSHPYSRECAITDRLIGRAGLPRGGLRIWFKRGLRDGPHNAPSVRCSRFLTALAQFHSNRSRLIHGVQFNPDLSATPFNTLLLLLLLPSSLPIIHILNCQSLLDERRACFGLDVWGQVRLAPRG